MRRKQCNDDKYERCLEETVKYEPPSTMITNSMTQLSTNKTRDEKTKETGTDWTEVSQWHTCDKKCEDNCISCLIQSKDGEIFVWHDICDARCKTESNQLKIDMTYINIFAEKWENSRETRLLAYTKKR